MDDEFVSTFNGLFTDVLCVYHYAMYDSENIKAEIPNKICEVSKYVY